MLEYLLYVGVFFLCWSIGLGDGEIVMNKINSFFLEFILIKKRNFIYIKG